MIHTLAKRSCDLSYHIRLKCCYKAQNSTVIAHSCPNLSEFWPASQNVQSSLVELYGHKRTTALKGAVHPSKKKPGKDSFSQSVSSQLQLQPYTWIKFSSWHTILIKQVSRKVWMRQATTIKRHGRYSYCYSPHSQVAFPS